MNPTTSNIKRIGILTGGGDCPGLNAVIRAVYRTATLQHGWEVLGIMEGFEGLVRPEYMAPGAGPGNRWLTADMVRGILPRGGTILGSTNQGDPFRYARKVDGVLTEVDISDEVLRNFRALGLDALVVVGGDGTMSIAHRLAEKGLPLVGVPKTIDNDLSATDMTFGFDTAVQTAVDAIDKLHTTAESHSRVMFLEVMGRHCGWIALTAGMAGGADVILLPEMPYEPRSIAKALTRRRQTKRSFGIVVVAEGARPVGGGESYEGGAVEPGHVRRLSGAAERAAESLQAFIGKEHRVTVLGHLQRGGGPSPVDRLLGTRFGTAAVDLLAAGQFDHMVCLRTPNITAVPIAEAISHPNWVDPKGQLVRSARLIGISFGTPDEI